MFRGCKQAKCPFFRKSDLVEHGTPPPPQSLTPNIQDRPWFNILWFLIFIIYHYLHNLHCTIASSFYNVGTTRKMLLCNFDFECLGSTAAVLVLEYLFTLVKAKVNQSVLKICQVKNIFQPWIFLSFILTTMVQHGKVYF